MGRSAEAAGVRGNLGRSYAEVGETAAALTTLDDALCRAEEAGDARATAVLAGIGMTLVEVGDPSRALTYIEKAQVLREKAGALTSRRRRSHRDTMTT
jgi:hypothetical protein